MSALDAPQILRRLAEAFRPALNLLARATVPTFRGPLAVRGLTAPVEVLRDRWGVPHIYAADERDLYHAQGFVHAQDRLFQMELQRRVASGRLAEAFGAVALGTDRLARTLGFRRLAEREWEAYEPRMRDLLGAYARGVNAYLEVAQGKLGIELRILGLEPEAWSPLDCLAFGKFQAFHLSHSWMAELTRARLVREVGPERAAELEPRHPDWQPCILDPRVAAAAPALSLSPALRAGLASPFSPPPHEGGVGSNSWALAPSRTTTGGAILANDMHLEIKIPGIWHLSHLVAADGSYNVTGTGIPGMPGILVGHNERIAWGATLGFCDQQDLYLEHLRGNGRPEYEFRGSWHVAQVHAEEIRVKGAAVHVETVIETGHGPVVGSCLPGGAVTGEGESLALCSMALRPGRTAAGFLAVTRARDWPEFTAAVRSIAAPDINFTYADVDGNVGYHLSGHIPIRARGDGRVPVPGWTGAHEWTSVIPAHEMPQVLNPPKGWVATANNRVADHTYPYHLGTAFMNGYRSARIAQVLEAGRMSLDDCRNLQMDVTSLAGGELVRRLEGHEAATPAARQALAVLRAWDRQMAPASAGAAVFAVLQARLVRILLAPLPPPLRLEVLGEGANPVLCPLTEFLGKMTETLHALLDAPASFWVAQAGGRAALIDRALAETVAALTARMGADPARWRWSALHRVYYQHPFTNTTLLGLFFDRGPHPIGGDTDTVHQSAYLPQRPYDNLTFSPSYRQIINLANLDDCRVIIPAGNSGHIGSSHYDDYIPKWLAGEYIPMLWSRAAVERETATTLVLTAAPR